MFFDVIVCVATVTAEHVSNITGDESSTFVHVDGQQKIVEDVEDECKNKKK